MNHNPVTIGSPNWTKFVSVAHFDRSSNSNATSVNEIRHSQYFVKHRGLSAVTCDLEYLLFAKKPEAL